MYRSKSKPKGCKKRHAESGYDPNCGDCRFGRLVQIDTEESSAPMGRNGGVACDTRSGPCNCGAWH